jgi:hypothetical protein
MPAEDKPRAKDTWDKIDIIGKGIVLPLMVAALTLVVNLSLSAINQRLKTTEHDIDLMTTFKSIYYGEKSKRLAVVFTSRISDSVTRNQLRTFLVWDALEEHLVRNPRGSFKFDQEEEDWHMLGDAVNGRYVEITSDGDSKAFVEWWTLYIKGEAYRRWPQQNGELSKLFRWVEATYVLSDQLPNAGRVTRSKLSLPQEINAR